MLKRLLIFLNTKNNCAQLVKTLFFLTNCAYLQAQAITESNTLSDTLSKTLEAVEIVSATPVSGSGLNRNNLPMTIQSLNAKKIKEINATNFTDLVNAALGSVHLNFAGGNVLQPDLNYRGFTASPILGISQGVAVYQDGAKVNELFGNVVNWDVLPTFALDNIELMAGSNPVFGLNALGGALSLRTKSGFSSHLERNVALEMGSFGRMHATAETGGTHGKWGYYVGGDWFKERGWRNYSPSQVGRFFAKGSLKTNKGMLHVSASLAQSALRGNGPIPVELLEKDRNEVFTHPDITSNTARQLNLNWTHSFNKKWSLQTVAYGKWFNTNTFNGDDSPYVVCDTGKYVGLLCEEPELNSNNTLDWEPILDQNGQTIKATDATSTAINNRTNTRQLSYGLTAQLSSNSLFLNKKSNFLIGLSTDGGNAQFESSVELAKLNNERGTEGSGLYDEEAYVDVKFKSRHTSLYFLESLSITDSLTVQLSGQVQHATIQLRDQIGEELNGDHEYLRFNPSLGLVWQINNAANIYSNYAISARTPTPVELTCADPNDPCRLPNAFLSDPPLKQAVAHTAEIGWRFRKSLFKTALETSIALFRTKVVDDIYFISAGASRNSGYFSNIGNTMRTGLELSGQYRVRNWRFSANYTWMKAIFKDDFTITSAEHPEAIDGEIAVKRNNSLPLIPNHIAKLGVFYSFITGDNKQQHWSIGTQFLFNSGQILRGDESNQLDKIKPYATGNVFVNCRLSRKISLSLRVNNMWNQQYETFGLLGEPDRLKGFEKFENPFFLTPAEPISVSVGAKFLF